MKTKSNFDEKPRLVISRPGDKVEDVREVLKAERTQWIERLRFYMRRVRHELIGG